MAVVRPEFRTDIYIPVPDDPVFAAGQCAVGDCDRTAVSIRRGLCNAHAIRFRKRGRPPMEDFLADPGPPVRGRRPLAPCVVDGCRYGRGARNGLCSKHRDRWDRAGQPDLASWDAPDLAPGDTTAAECRLPFCSSVGREPDQDLLRGPRRPVAAAWPARPRPVHRRLRARRHRLHRSAGPRHAAEAGDSVRIAVPARCALPHRRSAPGHARCPARQDGGRHLAAGPDRAAMAAETPAPGRRVGPVPDRRPRRAGVAARWDRLGDRVPTGRVAAAQAARHHRPGGPARPAPGCGSTASPSPGYASSPNDGHDCG